MKLFRLLLAGMGLAPALVFAATADASRLDLTGHMAGLIAIAIFVVA